MPDIRTAITRAILGGKPGGPWEGGIRAYHSSPYDFDKFDWSKLRTGEGANVYGAGFYAAENPAVSGQGGQYWKAFANRFGKSSGENTATEYLARAGFDREKAMQWLQHALDNPREYTSGYNKMTQERMRQDALQILASGQHVGPRTYEVNINARPELLLDWDKPLAQQPQLREPLTAAAKERSRISPDAMDMYRALQSDPYSVAGYNVDRISGENIYKSLRSPFAQKGPAASEALAEAGIPGIRYLDQGSRETAARLDALKPQLELARRNPGAAGWALNLEKNLQETPLTYNYVVTDPSKLDILAKYGIVAGAPIGMGATAALDQYGAQQQ